MNILGIDPGLRITGCAGIRYKFNGPLEIVLLQELKTQSKSPLSLRIAEIYQGVSNILQRLRPEVVVLEKIYSHYRHPATSALLGHVRGVIVLAAELAGVDIIEIPPTVLKKAVTGRGHSSKEQVKMMVSYFAGFKRNLKSEHLSDALGLAIAFIHRIKK